jgi:hypothetical protein
MCMCVRMQVCRKGQLLDPNQAALLRVFGIKMATFHITPLAWWSSQGEGVCGGGTGGSGGVVFVAQAAVFVVAGETACRP